MIKIPDLKARLVGGAAQLSNSEYVCHVVYSSALAAMVGLPGPAVPLPLLFKKFGTFYANMMPLYAPNRPDLSMLRIMVSPHPYALNSCLCVGTEDGERGILLFRTPVIRSSDFEDTPITVNSKLVIADNASFLHCRPFTAPEIEKTPPIPLTNMKQVQEIEKTTPANLTNIKQLTINELANTMQEYDPNAPPSSRDAPQRVKVSPRSILKRPPTVLSPDERPDCLLADIFFTMGLRQPQIGESPITAFNTVTIMQRANNSIMFLPNLKLKPIQHLFLKHVLLQRLGLENILFHFKMLYANTSKAAAPYQREYFECMLSRVKQRLEDMVFCLNSIESHHFKQGFKASGRAPQRLLTAADKYFLMFPPQNRDLAIQVGAEVIESICNGTPLSEVLADLSPRVEIKKETGNNLLKFYALLTV
ncbi:ORF23 [macacine gammaherpesvirus 12]|uniref:ORF23 n=1 Tax=macacine gammaherpesvirus 12 TaxID=2560571 RepID=A0A0B5CYD6_9GAMA|nr:ORF23 [Macaca nemestrina rhadinovirus 2]AJE29664.1 ORF23 [Macaca nemestrina rhadinovirus 2]